ncbi:hypothetical protein SGM_3548 [Streptomyces griseoaurantiacus M045]|uniref:Uncharacterized protein n=1 Tax=Streptomyces griseoaurantiacus M045 TaxID=996637 RepID=F3NK84_9ACTN|nr:hypothetical protein SGM_3548 [Streptomyces griseoaurantiacus M045]
MAAPGALGRSAPAAASLRGPPRLGTAAVLTLFTSPLGGSRTEIRWRLAVPRGDRRTPTDRVGPRHVRHLAAAAVCDGARSSNDYSSGRRTRARLETAAGFRSPRSTDAVAHAFTRTAPRARTSPSVPRFPAVCMAHRLRTVKTRRGSNFTPNPAGCPSRISDVTPFTVFPLVAVAGAFYRRDVSSRYISTT